jgi:hypothetical protein
VRKNRCAAGCRCVILWDVMRSRLMLVIGALLVLVFATALAVHAAPAGTESAVPASGCHERGTPRPAPAHNCCLDAHEAAALPACFVLSSAMNAAVFGQADVLTTASGVSRHTPQAAHSGASPTTLSLRI